MQKFTGTIYSNWIILDQKDYYGKKSVGEDVRESITLIIYKKFKSKLLKNEINKVKGN